MISILTFLISLNSISLPNLAKHETVIFFPAYGFLSEDSSTWNIRIHGWVFQEEKDSLARKLAVRIFRSFIGLEKQDPQTQVYENRAMYFLTDDEDEKKISISIGGTTYQAGKTDDGGHFETTVSIPVSTIKKIHSPKKDNADQISYYPIFEGRALKQFVGSAKLVSRHGTSIISDIDDTIKLTDVLDKKKAILNTFVNDYIEVPGMPELFSSLAKKGFAIHYVSASPWQLFVPLSDFFKSAGFPEGFWELKYFCLKDSSILNIFASPEKTKIPAIRRILSDFPKRKFILIGDNTEQDPEIYARIYREFPDQVLHIYIRNVRKDAPNSPEYQKTFADIPADRWSLFIYPKEIKF